MMARGDAGFGSRNVPGLIPDLPAVGHQEKPGCATPRLESRLFRPPWSLDIFGPPLAFLCRKLRRKLCQQKTLLARVETAQGRELMSRIIAMVNRL